MTREEIWTEQIQLKVLIGILVGVIISLLFVTAVMVPTIHAERPNYIYDWENLLTESEESYIDNLCYLIDVNTTAEIVIITLASYSEPLKVADINEACTEYFSEYPLDGVKGIGKGDKDNGVLIILSLTEGEFGIEVGYGLEGDLTDSEAGRIADTVIDIYLDEDNLTKALYIGVLQVGEQIGYGISPIVDVEQDEKLVFDPNLFRIVLVLGIVLMIIGMMWIMVERRKARLRREEIERERERVRNLPPPPPPKPVFRYGHCPKCDTKRKTKQIGSRRDERYDGVWWIAYTLLTLVCLICGTSFTKEKRVGRVESGKTRKQRKVDEEEEERQRRIRRRAYTPTYSSRNSDSSRGGSTDSGSSRPRSGGGFGGGRSGGGGARRKIGK